MSRTNNIPGLRSPSQSQQQRIAQMWQQGTSSRSLRRRQLIFAGLAVLMGLLKVLDSGIVAGLVIGVLVLVFFSPLLLIWNGRISRIERVAARLTAGAFQVTEAECERAYPDRWNLYYVGKSQVRLSDGTLLKNVDMPYYLADQMRKHSGSFRVWLVLVDGDSNPIVFPQ